MAPDLRRIGGTVSVTLPRLFLELVGEDRPEVLQLCQALGIDLTEVGKPDGRIERARAAALIDQLVVLSGDPNLSLKVADRVYPGMFQAVGFAMMSSPSLGEAFARLARFGPLVDDSLHITLQSEHGHTRMLGGPAGAPISRHLMEAGLAGLLAFCRFLSGGLPLRVLEISLTCPAPPEREQAERERVFGCTSFVYEAACNSVLFHGDDLRRSMQAPIPLLAEMHDFAVERQMESLSARTLISLKVRQAIAEQLGKGRAPTLAEVAASLRMTTRAVQRGLQHENAQFKSLLDEIRRAVAHLHLRHSHMSLKELSYELGFGEVSSFHRACVRWFGVTPQQYRDHAEGCAQGR